MYIVVKGTYGKHTPLKAFLNINDALQFLDTYVKQSSWKYDYFIADRSLNRKGHPEAKKYYRVLSNHTNEFVFIRYMRLIS